MCVLHVIITVVLIPVMENQTFATVDKVRDRGVTIYYRLQLHKHIAGVLHKAMNTANLILTT